MADDGGVTLEDGTVSIEDAVLEADLARLAEMLGISTAEALRHALVRALEKEEASRPGVDHRQGEDDTTIRS